MFCKCYNHFSFLLQDLPTDEAVTVTEISFKVTGTTTATLVFVLSGGETIDEQVSKQGHISH